MKHPYETWLAGAGSHAELTGRPLVGLCFAQSLDGCIAALRGTPLALSGRPASIITHRLRASHDAILIGIGTLISDDPQLSVRLVKGKNPQPIILDSHLRTPLDSRLLQPGRPGPYPWIAAVSPVDPACQAALESCGARVIPLPAGVSGGVDLTSLLEHLATSGINSLMVEGGAEVITSFLRQRLFDWVGITIAPVLLGGLRAVQSPLTSEAGFELLRLKEIHYRRAGEDLFVWGKR